MNLKQKFYRMCGKSRLYLKRSSPTILCCVAAFGVVGTAVAAVKVTPKAMKLLEDATDEKGGGSEQNRDCCHRRTFVYPGGCYWSWHHFLYFRSKRS